MAQPIVVQYGLTTAANATNVVNAVGTTGPNINLLSASVVLDTQRRLLFTTAGNESANTFVIVGLNAANMTVSENLTGPNASTTQTSLDYKTVISIKALATTAGTISVGTNGVGSSLWNIMNWNATPVNIECAVVVQSGSANWTVQYTYDDPNNLPANVSVPTAFNHPTLVATTSPLDGAINDPVTAIRFLINSGTGTIRGTIIQAGAASP
jgi:hypothetical protein